MDFHKDKIGSLFYLKSLVSTAGGGYSELVSPLFGKGPAANFCSLALWQKW